MSQHSRLNSGLPRAGKWAWGRGSGGGGAEGGIIRTAKCMTSFCMGYVHKNQDWEV